MASSKKTKPVNKNPKSSDYSAKQKDVIMVAILSLLLGLGGGYLIGNALSDQQTVTPEAMTEPTPTMHTTMFEVPADKSPKLELVVTEDAKSGYNIKLITTDFTFTPESVNKQNVIGEGHAHLYINGEKIGRIYGNYYHYNGTFEGSKTFLATLNANDHSEYAVDGSVIKSEVIVTHDSSDENHEDSHATDTDHME